MNAQPLTHSNLAGEMIHNGHHNPSSHYHALLLTLGLITLYSVYLSPFTDQSLTPYALLMLSLLHAYLCMFLQSQVPSEWFSQTQVPLLQHPPLEGWFNHSDGRTQSRFVDPLVQPPYGPVLIRDVFNPATLWTCPD